MAYGESNAKCPMTSSVAILGDFDACVYVYFCKWFIGAAIRWDEKVVAISGEVSGGLGERGWFARWAFLSHLLAVVVVTPQLNKQLKQSGEFINIKWMFTQVWT